MIDHTFPIFLRKVFSIMDAIRAISMHLRNKP
jgi:hypothetical protein